jgi:peptidoglycan/LPS O-acetylase OafA/YrhL
MWWFVEPMIAEGPMGYRYLHEQLKCTNYGWANFLFINNFVPQIYGAQCMGWAWYLAVDMQMFIVLGPLLVYLFLRIHRYWVFVLLVVVPLSCIPIAYSMYWSFYIPYMGVLSGLDYNTLVYGKPYARAIPFLFGLAFGAHLSRNAKYGPMQISPILVWCLHALAAASFVFCMLGHLYLIIETPGIPPTLTYKVWNVVYSTLYGPVWSLFLIWFIYSCYHGLIPRLVLGPLSWRLWTVIGRLGFSIYLVHPIILHWREYRRVQLIEFNLVWYIDNFLALFISSTILAFLVYITLERPLGALVKRWIK